MAATNIVFSLCMLIGGVAVAQAEEGFLQAFSTNGTSEGSPNVLCLIHGTLAFAFMTMSACFCVALSVASCRLTRGQRFVENKCGEVVLYLLCYGFPLALTIAAVALEAVGFRTENAWCYVEKYETYFILIPQGICVVTVVVLVGVMASFAAKLKRAGGVSQKKLHCLSMQYTRILLLCLAFTAVTIVAIVAKVTRGRLQCMYLCLRICVWFLMVVVVAVVVGGGGVVVVVVVVVVVSPSIRLCVV